MHRGFTPLELVMSLSVVSALAAALRGAASADPQREPAGSSKPARIIAAGEGS